MKTEITVPPPRTCGTGLNICSIPILKLKKVQERIRTFSLKMVIFLYIKVSYFTENIYLYKADVEIAYCPTNSNL